MLPSYCTKIGPNLRSNFIQYGAQGRNRTDTVSLPLDFESSASTNFTTRACLDIIKK